MPFMIHKKHHSWRGGLGRLCAAGAAALLLLPALGTAATRTVSNLGDNGAGSLREAIAASVNGDTINFSVAGTIILFSGTLTIARSIAINGPTSANLTVSGNNNSRVFSIGAGTVNISNLTIANGDAYVEDGGGIYVHSSAMLNLNNCTVCDNYALHGGGIFNRGTMTLNNCTVSHNGAGGDGGGIYNVVTMTLNNCTVSGNSAGNGTDGGGGGIYDLCAKTTLNNCTVSGNQASTGGGIDMRCSDASVVIRNTIIAGNSPRDVAGYSSSAGHNLIGKTDGSSGWLPSDLTGTVVAPLNPQLGPLQDNGGPTFTMALLPTSAAIDAGDDAVLGPPYNLSTDQRGRARRTGDHVDIGAYEFGGITRLVTTLNDSGGGSLRDALSVAMDLDRIAFAPVVTGKIRLTTGELLIDKLLSVVGPGAAQLAISGNNNSRVFHVGPLGAVNIYGLTITEGLVQAPQAPQAQPGMESRGAGLLNEGSLRMFDCMLTTNKVQGGSGGNGGPGGGGLPVNGGPGGSGKGAAIYSSGALALTRCTLIGNRAFGGDGGQGADAVSPGSGGGAGAGEGGAIWSTAVTPLENCTLADNRVVGGRGGNPGSDQFDNDAPPGTGGNGLGGALQGPFVLESCTITGNSGTRGLGGQGVSLTGTPGVGAGGGLSALGTPTIHNSIIASNTGSTTSPDINGTVSSQGWNLIGITDGSSGWTANDFLGNSTTPINPYLSPCQDNGGPVWTIGPLSGSPARDKGKSGLPTDARGGARIVDFPNVPNAPNGDGSDIGALEVDALLRITSISESNIVALLKFKSDPGSLYAFEQTSVVTSHIWTNFVGTPITGNGQELAVTNYTPLLLLPPWRFYRVRSN